MSDNINRNALLNFKNNFAILIAADDYKVAPLQTPIADALALKETLIKRQGFKEGDVLLLRDPDKKTLFHFLFQLFSIGLASNQKVTPEQLSDPNFLKEFYKRASEESFESKRNGLWFFYEKAWWLRTKILEAFQLNETQAANYQAKDESEKELFLEKLCRLPRSFRKYKIEDMDFLLSLNKAGLKEKTFLPSEIIEEEELARTHFDEDTQGFLQRFQEALSEDSKRKNSLFFYYAGHGVAGDMTQGQPKGYLLPIDSSFENVVLSQNQHLVPMEMLFDSLEALDIHHTLLILDCCFAGSFSRVSKTRDLGGGRQQLSIPRFERYKTKPAWQVIASSGPSEKAADLISSLRRPEEAKHSPFAKALIEALNGEEGTPQVKPRGKKLGDGVITSYELFLYLHEQVEKSTRKARNFNPQNPDIFPFHRHEGGQYIFCDPRHVVNQQDWLQIKDMNPYKGLSQMDIGDSPFYFGRSEDVRAMLEAIRPNERGETPAALIITGPSGSGKSSLAKAGLLAELLDKNYELFQMKPAQFPWRLTKYQEEDKEGNQEAGWKTIYESENLTLALPDRREDRIEGVFYLNPKKRQVLLIDQYEELFTKTQTTHRKVFEKALENLFELATTGDTLIILTIRADFEWQLESSSFGKKFYLSNADYYEYIRLHRISELGLDNLREALVNPALMLAYDFEKDQHKEGVLEQKDLVDTILEDLNYVPNALPLLSFTMQSFVKYLLEKTADGEDKRLFTRKIYEKEIKGVGGVLAKKMNDIYRGFGLPPEEGEKEVELSPTPETPEQEAMKRIFLRLIQISDGDYIRRRVYIATDQNELHFENGNELVKKVLDKLISEGLLIVDSYMQLPFIEWIHDALINTWTLGKQWIKGFGKDQILLQRALWQSVLEDKNKAQSSANAPANTDDIRKNDSASEATSTSTWERNPKFSQVLNSILNTSLTPTIHNELSLLYKELFPQEEVGHPLEIDQLNSSTAPLSVEEKSEEEEYHQLFKELLDIGLQREVQFNLDAFILTGASHHILNIYLKQGEHWLNSAEEDFIKRSWENRAKGVLKIKAQRDAAIKAKEEVVQAQEAMINGVVESSWKSTSYLAESQRNNQEKDLKFTLDAPLGLYQKIALIMDLEKLQSLSPIPIFLKGPHDKELNFHSLSSFGHYNPEFIAWAKKYLLPFHKKPILKRLVSPFYKWFLQQNGRLYYLAYKNLSLHPEILSSYRSIYEAHLAQIAQGAENLKFFPADHVIIRSGDFNNNLFPNPEFQAKVREVGIGMENNYAIAIFFWVRRFIDGTAEGIFDILYQFMWSFDPLWLNNKEKDFLKVEEEQEFLLKAFENFWPLFLDANMEKTRPLIPHFYSTPAYRYLIQLEKWMLAANLPIFLSEHSFELLVQREEFNRELEAFNPDFFDWIKAKALPVKRDPLKDPVYAAIFEKYKITARGYYLAFQILASGAIPKNEFIAAYRDYFSNPENRPHNYFSFMEKQTIMDFNQLVLQFHSQMQRGHPKRLLARALSFWIKRNLDQSALIAKEILDEILKLYDTDWFKRRN